MPETTSNFSATATRVSNRVPWRTGLGLLLLIVLGVVVWFGLTRTAGAPAASVVDYLPEDTQAAMVVQPAALLRSRLVAESFPAATVQAQLDALKSSSWPLDLRRVEQIGVYWSPTFPGISERRANRTPAYNATVVVLFSPGVIAEQEAARIPQFSEKWIPYTVSRGKAWTEKVPESSAQEIPADAVLTLYSPAPRVLIVGCRDRVLAAGQLNGGTGSPLKEVFGQADLSQEFVFAALDLNDIRIPHWMALQMGPELSLFSASVFVMYKQSLIHASVTPGNSLIDLSIECRDEDFAEQLEQQLEYVRTHLKFFAGFVSLNPDSASTQQLLIEIDKQWRVSRSGNNVRLMLPLTDRLLELLKPALQPALPKAAG